MRIQPGVGLSIFASIYLQLSRNARRKLRVSGAVKYWRRTLAGGNHCFRRHARNELALTELFQFIV